MTKYEIVPCDAYIVTADNLAGEGPANGMTRAYVVHYTARRRLPNGRFMVACEGTKTTVHCTHWQYHTAVREAMKETGFRTDCAADVREEAQRLCAEKLLTLDVEKETAPAFESMEHST